MRLFTVFQIRNLVFMVIFTLHLNSDKSILLSFPYEHLNLAGGHVP